MFTVLIPVAAGVLAVLSGQPDPLFRLHVGVALKRLRLKLL